jgi:DNA-binding transcriptional LysR family regulator
MTEIEQRRDLQSGNLVRLLTEWETDPYPLHALLPSGRFVANRVRALVDFIAGRFAAFGPPSGVKCAAGA